MKYSGSIIGLDTSYGSIYNAVTDDRKCYLWKANIIADFKGKMLSILFNWDGDAFEMKLSELKESYYTGKVFVNREEIGTIYLWLFKRGKELMLKGDFNEESTAVFNCFLELRPL